MSKKFILIVWSLITSLVGYNQVANPIELFNQANNAYDSSRYEEAKNSYNELLESNYVSPNLFYNAGNTYFKLHEYAKSILYYEKALKHGFDSEKVKHNLSVVRKRITDKHEESRAGFGQWIASFVGYTVDFWTWISIFFLIAALLAFVWFKRASNASIIKITKIKFSVFLSLFFLFTIVAIIKYNNVANPNSGIVVQASFTVKTEPNFASESAFVLHEGSKVVILDSKDDWFEIRFGANVGWIEQDVIALI